MDQRERASRGSLKETQDYVESVSERFVLELES